MRDAIAKKAKLIAGDKITSKEAYEIADGAIAIMNEMNKAIAANVIATVKENILNATAKPGEKDG